MKLGLIGTGKQGQRYLMEKNGGRHIVRSGSRSIDYEGLDGVIIATHPAGHKKLALECIERGLPVLVEKPLALTERDCMDIIDAAEKASVFLMVAHTYLWSESWAEFIDDANVRLGYYDPEDEDEHNEPLLVDVFATYTKHNRDYSPWLDWGPHLLAMAAELSDAEGADLKSGVVLANASHKRIMVAARYGYGESLGYSSGFPRTDTYEPMDEMVKVFMDGGPIARHSGKRPVCDNDFNRRVYRALFSEG